MSSREIILLMEPYLVLVRTKDPTIRDDWHMSAMQGTGSNTW